jgi:phosphomannomutase
MNKIQFGTDGWRGIIAYDFTIDNVKKVSQAVANYLKKQKNPSVMIGYDMRFMAEEFAQACAGVMSANNIKVYLSDQPLATPSVAVNALSKKCTGAIMFTASHNPAKFLGFKYMTGSGATAPSKVTDQFQKNIDKIKSQKDIRTLDFDKAVQDKRIIYINPNPAYKKALSKLVDINKIKSTGLKILFNPMYGSGQQYLDGFLSGKKTKVDVINSVKDPLFGGIHPEPIVKENILDQIKMMKKGKYDIGIAFDGDADRIGLIDEKGNFISSLDAFLLSAYYFWHVLGDKRPIVRTRSNTVTVDHLAKKLGRKSYEVQVGFKYCAEKMQDVKAVLAGEESGGSGFASHLPVRDAMAYALYILDLLVKTKKPISNLLKDAKKLAGGGYEFARIDIKMPYDGYFNMKEKASKNLAKNPPKKIAGFNVVKSDAEDGVKFWFADNSWLLIRFSGTEPKLRTYAEAKTKKAVDKLLAYAPKIIKQANK